WARRDEDLAQIDIVTQYDPLLMSDVGLYRWRSSGYATARGLEARVTRRFGRLGRAWLSYSYTDAERDIPNVALGVNGLPSASIRPHTLAGVVMIETGPDEKALGGVVSRTGVYATARVGSGTGFTHCTVPSTLDVGKVSDAVCSHAFKGEFEEERMPAFSQVDLKLTRGLPIGRTTLTLFADLRNLFNASNTVRVFLLSGKTTSSATRNTVLASDLASLGAEGSANGAQLPDGSIDLSFGSAVNPEGACGAWVTAAGASSPPNCIYLIRAEQRFGNGDHVYTPSEQTRASEAYYMVRNGLQNFTGPGRRVRFGAELRF
ncbi:MAG: TonB-dependent receptor, partial [Gemmatimonadota bacterium]|nr:TonB-dependent receptor [Gemmatimonadota bacterium]